MFQFLRGIVLIVALMALCEDVFAEVDRTSANYVMQGCRGFIENNNPRDLVLQGFCAGKIDGLMSNDNNICSPPDILVGQEVRVVVQYIDNRPNRLHENFASLATEALRAAWPCNR